MQSVWRIPLLLAILVTLGSGCGKPIVSTDLETSNVTPIPPTEEAPHVDRSLKLLQNDAELMLVEIRSERGIGRSVVKAPSPSWPPEVALYLHLRALESLIVEAGDMTWEANISSSGEHQITCSLTPKDLPPTPSAAKITIMPSEQPVTAIPLKDGEFFKVVLPPQLFESKPAEIKLSWVDFYR